MLFEKAIEIDNLYFTYPDGTSVLKGINLKVKKGETIAVVGPNGAGKSTLLLHLNGTLKGTGAIKIFGQSVEDADIKEIRRRVGLVFQDPDDQLFCPTVFDDVAFGPINMGLPRDEVVTRTQDALKQVGMEDFEKKSAHHLSLGQKKRVSIATVLSMNPDILAIDEPSSNLDPKSRRMVIEVLAGLPVTKIIITHDLLLAAELSDRAVILNRGKVAVDGKLRSIFSNADLLESHDLEIPHTQVQSTLEYSPS